MKASLSNRNRYHQSGSFHRRYLSQFNSIPLLPLLNYRSPWLQMDSYFTSARDFVCVDTELMLANKTSGVGLSIPLGSPPLKDTQSTSDEMHRESLGGKLRDT